MPNRLAPVRSAPALRTLSAPRSNQRAVPIAQPRSSYQWTSSRKWAATNRGGTCRLPKSQRSSPSRKRAKSTCAPGGRSGIISSQPMLSIANAPCSWGVLEFEDKTASPRYEQVLDEIAATGYAGTELGDWGFMPTDPAQLREALRQRGLGMVGAFVTTRLVDSRSYAGSR